MRARAITFTLRDQQLKEDSKKEGQFNWVD